MILHRDMTQPRPVETFVFGSNLRGAHGAGSARVAAELYGAQYGVGVGPTGRCYAIPTKDQNIQSLDLMTINGYVRDFVEYVLARPNEQFFITRIGCGLAGYKDEDIAPMFNQIAENVNCSFPEEWAPYLKV